MLSLIISTYFQIAYAWLAKVFFGKVVTTPTVTRADHVRYVDRIQTLLFSLVAAFFVMNALSPVYVHNASLCWSVFAALTLVSFNVSFGLHFYAKWLDDEG